MHFVYVLWSARIQKRYVGSSDNVHERLRQHNSGGSRFTSRGIPWQLVHVEEYETKTEARKRENVLKSGIGRKWLDQQYPEYRRGAGVAFS